MLGHPTDPMLYMFLDNDSLYNAKKMLSATINLLLIHQPHSNYFNTVSCLNKQYMKYKMSATDV